MYFSFTDVVKDNLPYVHFLWRAQCSVWLVCQLTTPKPAVLDGNGRRARGPRTPVSCKRQILSHLTNFLQRSLWRLASCLPAPDGPIYQDSQCSVPMFNTPYTIALLGKTLELFAAVAKKCLMNQNVSLR